MNTRLSDRSRSNSVRRSSRMQTLRSTSAIRERISLGSSSGFTTTVRLPQAGGNGTAYGSGGSLRPLAKNDTEW